MARGPLPHTAAPQAGAGRGAARRDGREGRRRPRAHLRDGRSAALPPQGGHAVRARAPRKRPLRLLRRRDAPHRAVPRLPGRGRSRPQGPQCRGARCRAPAHPSLRRGPRRGRAAPRRRALRLCDRRRAAHARHARGRAARRRPSGLRAARRMPRGHEHRPERERPPHQRDPGPPLQDALRAGPHARQAARVHLRDRTHELLPDQPGPDRGALPARARGRRRSRAPRARGTCSTPTAARAP